MNSGFRSQAVSDAFTQRQIHVERAKTALHAEHDAIAVAVQLALITALGKLSTQKFGSISKADLRRVVSSVLASYDGAADKYQTSLLTWLENYAEEEARYATSVLNEALGAEEEPAPVWPFVAGALIGATGLSSRGSIAAVRATQRNAVKKLIQRAYAQKWTNGQLLTAFRGTSLRKFKDGLLSKLKRAAAATVDTVVQHGMSASRFKVLQSYLDWTLGYTWVSILDGKTSDVCRSLSGQVFKFGAGPLPPAHYRCRSHIEPIFKRTANLQRNAAGAFTAGETYYTWLKAQPAKFQDEVLGKTKGRLFRRGGLSADEFAARVVNARYEPLTLDELRKKSPRIFARAGV